jgi:DUF1680 family protein
VSVDPRDTTDGIAVALRPMPVGEPGNGRSSTVTLVPYHSWAERGPSVMRVWMPVADHSN